jgi:NAD(P)-dependent dehydrogenase (short-subunit alcohol dehydrogenase family)
MAEWGSVRQVVLITGGGSGIGAAAAGELARRGAAPVLADLDADGMAATAASIDPASLTLLVILVDQAACEAAVAETVGRHGKLDAVWANAGIGSRTVRVGRAGGVGARHRGEPARGVSHRSCGAAGHRGQPRVCRRDGVAGVLRPGPGDVGLLSLQAGVEAMCNSLRLEVAHRGVAVGTIHPTWIDTPMVREGDAQSRAFRRLRESMSPPFRRTYPVERAARDIADGFERRARRICTPGFLRAAHVLRAAMTTRAFERDALRAAPDIVRLFENDVAEHGAAAASLSERARCQLGDVP